MDLVAVHVARPFIWLRHSILSPGGPLHSFSQYVTAVTLCNVKPQKWYFLFFWWLRFDSHCINSNYPCLWLICSIKNSQINYNGSLSTFFFSLPGVGVILVTVSGAAWRMTAPGGGSCSCLGFGSSVDLGRCSRRPCSRGGGAPHGLLYPEFQHRPPPPSYQASMQEYRLR